MGIMEHITAMATGTAYTGNYPDVNRKKWLLDKAKEFAWKKGTKESKYRYPSGRPLNAFKKALDEVYPTHTQWGDAPSKGASCDVFVGTCARASGIAKAFPRGLEEQFDYKPKNFFRYVYHNCVPLDKAKEGDIVMFDYDSGAHTVILGKGCYYEANYKTYFGHTNGSTSRLKSRYPKVVILRPRNSLRLGDKGTQVKRLQKYMNWFFGDHVVEVDGEYGEKTQKYAKKMRVALGMTEKEGIIGQVCVKRMKAYRK